MGTGRCVFARITGRLNRPGPKAAISAITPESWTSYHPLSTRGTPDILVGGNELTHDAGRSPPMPPRIIPILGRLRQDIAAGLAVETIEEGCRQVKHQWRSRIRHPATPLHLFP